VILTGSGDIVKSSWEKIPEKFPNIKFRTPDPGQQK